ncbi:MAG: (d)CMP kinase [Pseudomonadales bacterium]|nr:(d)CMP kinase [Pseudomonadales bacterium]
MTIPVLTIDGPSGSGKGTIAAQLAEALGWHLLDSGALYRIIGVTAQHRDLALDPKMEPTIAAMAEALQIEFVGELAVVDGVDITTEIRNEDGGAAASKVAAMPAVRDSVMALQRGFRREPGLVADGRDMGTVVFTDAPLKVFLDASAEERAQRRYKQLKNKGLSVSLPGLLEQIQERDARDRGRTVAPLKPAEDALVIDSTSMTIEAVFDQVMVWVKERGLTNPS